MHVTDLEPFQFFLSNPLNISDELLSVGDALRLKCSGSTTIAAYCLDDFESSLRTSRRLLIRYKNNLLLLQVHTAVALSQECPTKWSLISELPDGPVKQAMQDCSAIRAFMPGKKNTLRIEQYNLLDDDEKTNVRCTLYHLNNNDNALVFGVTQPLRGYGTEHALLQDQLRKYGAIATSSYDEIYAQFGFDQPVYNAKPQVSISVDAPVIETANHLIQVSMDVARQNEEGIKADYDTEFLHDYRVALRKARSIISLFKGVYSEADTLSLKQDFSQIMKSTNSLRDLDVYLLDKKHLFDLLPTRMHIGLDQMFDAFAGERKKQLQLVIKNLSSKSYQSAIQTLQKRFTDGSIPGGSKALTHSLTFATKLIWKRYTKVCLIARHINDETPDEEVHELRIQCKKLRYLMEFFSDLFPQKIKPLIKSLKRLQDNLGRFNDFSVQQESLQVFLTTYAKKHRSKNLIAMAESVGALIILLQQKQFHERAQVIQSFSRFDSPEIREEFSKAFQQEQGITQ
ncbi:MAG: CHAD domain-containing protein [Gammaproteobacteria bacterium]|nr:CHAD domain-containing protein [Gammaproteobacteria bacterium]